MDEQPPKTPARRASKQDIAEDEVRRAARELTAYFKGRRSHREALAALKTIKRFVRAQQKQNATTTIPLRLVRSEKKTRTASGA